MRKVTVRCMEKQKQMTSLTNLCIIWHCTEWCLAEDYLFNVVKEHMYGVGGWLEEGTCSSAPISFEKKIKETISNNALAGHGLIC